MKQDATSLQMRTAELATAIVRQLGNKPTVTREIVGMGTVNHVFVVGTPSGEELVVRFCRDPSDIDTYDEESWCLHAARRCGVPVPELIAVGELDGVRYIVQSFVEGENADSHRSPELWRTLGRYACMVNGIAMDSSAPLGLFGRFGRDPVRSWRAHVEYNLEQLGSDDPLIRLNVYAPSQQRALRACIESLHDRIDRFGLTHGDLVPRNVLLPSAGPATLVDWGSASVGPAPFLDYLRIATDDDNEGFSRADLNAFAEGYGLRLDRVVPLAEDIHLLNRIDLVRWALDHQRLDRLPEIVSKARRTVALRLRT
jgi:aminoglycoside phosphotransferase (APT) family kinase protein